MLLHIVRVNSACCVTFHLKIKIFSSNYSFRNTIRVSNSLDPDHDLPSVRPDLDPNCLQRLSADNKSPLGLARKELKLSCTF